VLRIIDETFSDIESRTLDAIDAGALTYLIDSIDKMLGLKLTETTPAITDEQKAIIAERQTARDNKDWTRSDELRDQLAEQGIVVRDTSSGPIWEYK